MKTYNRGRKAFMVLALQAVWTTETDNVRSGDEVLYDNYEYIGTPG